MLVSLMQRMKYVLLLTMNIHVKCHVLTLSFGGDIYDRQITKERSLARLCVEKKHWMKILQTFLEPCSFQ